MTDGIAALDHIKDSYYHNEDWGGGTEHARGGDRSYERGTELAHFADRLLDKYFGEDAEIDDEQTAPAASANSFAFGAPPAGFGSPTALPPQRPPAPTSNTAFPPQRPPAPGVTHSPTALPPQRAPAPTNLTGPAFIPFRPQGKSPQK